MNTNKIIIGASVILIFLLISIPTTYKVIKNHNNHLYEAINDKIIESAKKCYYDEICKEDKITLKFLYENKYLTKVSNPVTKEYYNEESYVTKDNNVFKFIPVE